MSAFPSRIRSGSLGETFETYDNLYKVLSDNGEIQRIHKIEVHTFSVVLNYHTEEEDMISAVENMMNWKESEHGKWVMANALEAPVWHSHIDHLSFMCHYKIVAKFLEKDYTVYLLKWK